MEINSTEEYEEAKKTFAKLFHEDPCKTDYYKSQILMKALDVYELKLKKDLEISE